MNNQTMAQNETIQLHELLTLKNLCLTKSVSMAPLVSDAELKAILHKEVTTGKQHIKSLNEIMSQSSIDK